MTTIATGSRSDSASVAGTGMTVADQIDPPTLVTPRAP